jgi:hypothetical protein
MRVTFQGTATVGTVNTLTLYIYANSVAIWSQTLGSFTGTAQFRGEADILTAVTGASGQLAVFGTLFGSNATLVPVADNIMLNAGTAVNLISTSGVNLYFAVSAASAVASDTVNMFYSHWELKQ